jgi:hypothetical protein
MNDHIPKPIDAQELFRVLSQWTRARNAGATLETSHDA